MHYRNTASITHCLKIVCSTWVSISLMFWAAGGSAKPLSLYIDGSKCNQINCRTIEGQFVFVCQQGTCNPGTAVGDASQVDSHDP